MWISLHSYLDLCGLLDLGICFMPQFRDIFSDIFFNKFSAPFSLFSFWDLYNANDIPLNISLKLASLFKNSFFFLILWVSSTLLSSKSLIFSFASSSLFFSSIIVFLSSVNSVWYFLILSVSLWKFSLCSFTLSQVH